MSVERRTRRRVSGRPAVGERRPVLTAMPSNSFGVTFRPSRLSTCIIDQRSGHLLSVFAVQPLGTAEATDEVGGVERFALLIRPDWAAAALNTSVTMFHTEAFLRMASGATAVYEVVQQSPPSGSGPKGYRRARPARSTRPRSHIDAPTMQVGE